MAQLFGLPEQHNAARGAYDCDFPAHGVFHRRGTEGQNGLQMDFALGQFHFQRRYRQIAPLHGRVFPNGTCLQPAALWRAALSVPLRNAGNGGCVVPVRA